MSTETTTDAAVKPRRIQLSRRKGWRKPEGAVVVSRPTYYGNPFNVDVVGRGVAVRFYRKMLQHKWAELERALKSIAPQNPEVSVVFNMMELQMRAHWIGERLHLLRGKDLCCWCPLGSACHADVLLELANAPEPR